MLAPRDTRIDSGFREIPGGATLVLGPYRYVRSWLGGAIVFGAIALVFLLLMISFPAGTTPSGGSVMLLFLPSILLFAGFGGALAFAAASRMGTWSLAVDEAGLQLIHGNHRPKQFAWSRVARIRYGPVAVQITRSRSELADGLRIELRPRGSRQVDTTRYRMSADDLDRMVALIRSVAERHAIPVETFPMAGRSQR